MLQQISPALRMTILMTLVTGLLYPGAITGVCQLLFRTQANGSIISQNRQVIGSAFIGQNFTKPEYFHPRPSAAGKDGYDATSSSGSNLGPTSQRLIERMKASAARFRKENPDYAGPIPADALTASGSGLDPDISLANASAQAARIAKARSLSIESVQRLIKASAQNRDLGFLGEPRINVLKLNMALDRQFTKSRAGLQAGRAIPTRCSTSEGRRNIRLLDDSIMMRLQVSSPSNVLLDAAMSRSNIFVSIAETEIWKR